MGHDALGEESPVCTGREMNPFLVLDSNANQNHHFPSSMFLYSMCLFSLAALRMLSLAFAIFSMICLGALFIFEGRVLSFLDLYSLILK